MQRNGPTFKNSWAYLSSAPKEPRNILANTLCVRTICNPMESSVPTFAEAIGGLGTSALLQPGIEVALLTAK